MSDYYLLLYMGIDVCQITIYCSTGGDWCVSDYYLLLYMGIDVCQITIYCSTGELVCVRLLSTVVQGN